MLLTLVTCCHLEGGGNRHFLGLQQVAQRKANETPTGRENCCHGIEVPTLCLVILTVEVVGSPFHAHMVVPLLQPEYTFGPHMRHEL